MNCQVRQVHGIDFLGPLCSIRASSIGPSRVPANYCNESSSFALRKKERKKRVPANSTFGRCRFWRASTYPTCLLALSYPYKQKAHSHQIFHFCQALHCSRHTTIALNLDIATPAMFDVDLVVREKGAFIGHSGQIAEVERVGALRPISH